MRRKSGKFRRDSYGESRLYGAAKALAIPLQVFALVVWLAAGFFDSAPLVGDPVPAEPKVVTEIDAPGANADGPAADPSATTEADLDATVAAVLSDDPHLRIRTVISHHGLLVGITKRLPDDADILGRFVNVRLAMWPGPNGVRITRMAVGKYEIPPKWVGDALDFYKSWLPASGEVMTLLSRIETIDPDRRIVTFNAGPTANNRG